jgi:hypothetical protein
MEFVRPDYMKDDLPDEESTPERLYRLLRIIWVNPEFWEIVRTGTRNRETFQAMTDYLGSRYLLAIPFGPRVWRKLVNHPMWRDYLFGLMVMSASRFFHFGPANPQAQEKILECEFTVEEMGLLLDAYIRNPNADQRSTLTGKLIDTESAKTFRLAVGKLQNDLTWVINNPGKVHATRSPTPKHNLPELSHVHCVEEMVGILRDEPALSDYELAFRQFGSPERKHRARAKQAKLVAQHREQIPVEWHKSRGDKSE